MKRRAIILALLLSGSAWALPLCGSHNVTGAPTISALSVTNITSSSATLTWTTDVAADSHVAWMSNTGNYDHAPAWSDSGGVTSHSVNISPLDPSTTYHYAVASYGLTSGSPDPQKLDYTSCSLDPTFTTAAVNTGLGYDFRLEQFNMPGLCPDVVNRSMTCGAGHLMAGNSMPGLFVIFTIAGTGSATSINVTNSDGSAISSHLTVTYPGGTGTVTAGCWTNNPGAAAVVLITMTADSATPVGTQNLRLNGYANNNCSGTAAHTKAWTLAIDAATPLPSATPASYPHIRHSVPEGDGIPYDYTTDFGLAYTRMCSPPDVIGSGIGNGTEIESWYYDGMHTWRVAINWMGDNKYRACMNAVNGIWQPYAAGGDGSGHRNYTTGLAEWYSEQHDPKALSGIVGLTTNSQISGNYNSAVGNPLSESRESALQFNAEIDYYLYHGTDRATQLGQAENIALTWLDSDLISQTANLAEVQAFYDGLRMRSLIRYYTFISPDIRIPWAIKRALDTLRSVYWINIATAQLCADGNCAVNYNPYGNELAYNNGQLSAGIYSQGLEIRGTNMLIAPAFAWMFKYTGGGSLSDSSTYQADGDALFEATYVSAGSLADNVANLLKGKDYGTQHLWSDDYIRWRSDPKQNIHTAGTQTGTRQ